VLGEVQRVVENALYVLVGGIQRIDDGYGGGWDPSAENGKE
jgi:hypothetical protein